MRLPRSRPTRPGRARHAPRCSATPPHQRDRWAAWPAARTFVQTASTAFAAGAAGVPSLASVLGTTPTALGADGCAYAACAIETGALVAVAALIASRRDNARPLFRLDGGAVGWGVGGAVAATAAVAAAQTLLASPDSAATATAAGLLRSASTGGAAALLAASGAIAPVMEETVYRGVLLAGLIDAGVPAAAAAGVSAVLFAASHVAVAPADVAPLAALGAVLSGCWLLSGGNTAASSLAHGLFNVGVLVGALVG